MDAFFSSSFFRIAVAGVVLIAGWLWWRRGKQQPGMRPGNTTFTRDLTKEARDGRTDAVIGREEEIERVIQIGARRLKNNPLLIGEAGVGKTAVVEGLARRIVEGRVPPSLKGKRVLSLNLADLLAGTAYRGELESRLKALLDQLESEPNSTILFIDELHLIEQSKGTQGGLSIADLLKPALARGDLAIIGATTWDEYRHTLQNDRAIDRRFQPVIIGEPSPETALAILRGVKEIYEKHHQVAIDDEALTAAVRLSIALIKDRRLPDKALDLIDEAAAMVAIEASLGHKTALGMLDAAARMKIAKRIAEEKQALGREAAHLDELAKNFPADASITAASEEIKEHVKELGDAENSPTTNEGRPRLTAADIEEVAKDWKTYHEK